ncbi:proline-rich protein 2-like [Vidua chalybeata]|uniref:proline-rich protein 2-like n=1 Tax=Vidua chalybeata TaxID=81927 RepID=UPI0023A8DCFD|nr:proline-rich protein 2-like [Vidua chalybeata]
MQHWTHPPLSTQKWGSGSGDSPPRGPGNRGKRGRSSDVTGSPGPAPSPGRGRGHRGGFLAARWGRHGRRAGGPLPPRCLLLLFFLLLLLTGGTARAPPPRPLLLPRGRGGTSPHLPGVSSRGGPRSARHEAAPPPDGRRRSGRCAVRVALPPGRARPPGHRHGRAHTRTDTQRDGAGAEIPEVPPCRPPGRASPRPRPPSPPRPGAARETHRRAAHPAAATTFHPGRQPAAAASPFAAGSGRGRKYEEEARRALRYGAPFLARDAGFAGGGCAAVVGFLHQLRGCVCTPHMCVSVCARSPCRVTLPGQGLPSLLPRHG